MESTGQSKVVKTISDPKMPAWSYVVHDHGEDAGNNRFEVVINTPEPSMKPRPWFFKNLNTALAMIDNHLEQWKVDVSKAVSRGTAWARPRKISVKKWEKAFGIKIPKND